MRMHNVPALISILGGLRLFGISGMILGPAIVAVTAALLETWRRRTTGAEEARVLSDGNSASSTVVDNLGNLGGSRPDRLGSGYCSSGSRDA